MNNREKEIYQTTLTGTALNAALIVLKFVAGIVGRSSAMIADAVHSLSDFVTDMIVLIFVRIADKPRDKGHDYGHGKFETFATLIIGLILALAGVGLMVNGIELIIASANGSALPRPGMAALIIAVVSIVSKEWLYHYTIGKGRKVRSQAVIANAWHHRSDAFSSGGTLIGIAGAMFLGEKWRILDPVAAVIVSLFIIKSGYDIMKPSVSELLEASLSDDDEKEIRRVVENVDGIRNVQNMRTRHIGNNIAVDLQVTMDGSMTLHEAHAIATQAEQAVRTHFGDGSFVNIHMEPDADYTMQK